MVVVEEYAQTVNAQINPNSTTKWNKWENEANAVGHTSTFAKAKYTRSGKKGSYKYVCPVYLSAHDFRLNIPDTAYIKNVTIEVRAKTDSSKLKVVAPTAWFMVYDGAGKVTQQKTKGKTGWYNNTFRYYQSSNLSTSEKSFFYTLSGAEWNKMKYATSQLNRTVMGVDLHFETPSKMDCTSANVLIKWVRIKVEYDLPDYYLKWTPNGSQVSPVEVDVNVPYQLKAEFGNRTKANGGNQNVYIQLPFGTILDSYSPSNANISIMENNQYKWVCKGGAEAKNYVTLNLISKFAGLKSIDTTMGTITWQNYINPISFNDDIDYVECLIDSGDIQQMKPSCFNFSAKVNSTDGNVAYRVRVESENRPDVSKISDTFKSTFPNGSERNFLVSWELLQSSSADGVSIDYFTSDSIAFNVPPNEDVEIKFRGCFIPINSGANTLVLTNLNDNSTFSYSYYSIPFSDLEFNIVPEVMVMNDHRILAVVDSYYNIIPFSVNPLDRFMLEKNCTLRMRIQERVPYIGCIPLKYSHYDPKSTYSNKGLKESYKNKTYMGKEGVIEEDIGLNIKMPPADVTTLQGLTKLDKPVPINTVPEAFEGDVLNHRGWVELTEVTAEKTNPHLYDVDAEVDYLTHNINSRFMIKKGVKIIDSIFDSLMGTVVESGDEFANYTYVNLDGETVTSDNGYFSVDTDGSYIYDSDAVENQRTLISLDNNQSLSIKSVEELPEHFDIVCEWSSTKIPENRENNVERIIYLLDGEGTPILEYQYYDLEFSDEAYYKCNVMCRVMTSSGWDILFTDEINLSVDLEALSLKRDSVTGELVTDTVNIDEDVDTDTSNDENVEIYSYSDYMYGSTVHFTMDMNKLTIIDEGVSGRELARTVYLDYAPRSYLLQFKNKNVDGDTNDVLTFFDFEVSESVLISDYENQYGNLIVSSFPIADKLLVFTRDSEEGMLYYYHDDGGVFTYIQEPFYMYFCGVDLKANNDVSIFDLNNSYSIFYLQNGLVRIGFNRLNGEIYIAKYDFYTKQYITVSYLQLTNFTDFQIGAYSDDKIEVVVGTTVFTMYRGHPYVVVKHEDEDIKFTTIWNKIYGESVNGQSLDLPALWELANYNNMLPPEIASDYIDSNAWIVDSDDENEDANIFPTLNLSRSDNDTIYNNEDVFFDVSGSVTSSGNTVIDEQVPLDMNTYQGVIGTYTIEVETDPNAPYRLDLRMKPIFQVGENSLLQGVLETYDGDGISGRTIHFYEIYELALKLASDKQIIQSGDKANLSVQLIDSTDGSLLRQSGQTVHFYEVYTPDIELSGDLEIMQTGDTLDLQAKVKDSSDGSLIKGERVHFYVMEDEDI